MRKCARARGADVGAAPNSARTSEADRAARTTTWTSGKMRHAAKMRPSTATIVHASANMTAAATEMDTAPRSSAAKMRTATAKVPTAAANVPTSAAANVRAAAASTSPGPRPVLGQGRQS